MDSKVENKELNLNEPKIDIYKIKSNYILKNIFNFIQIYKSLNIIKINKKLQKRIGVTKKDYESFIIELKLHENKYGQFIKIGEGEESYYHIYFNENKKKVKRNHIDKNDKVSKINIILDCKVKSFQYLFCGCNCIESINFKNFYKDNINNMSYMFDGCSSLYKINFENFNASNVKNMSYMFCRCSSLKEVNISTLNTSNVTNMEGMFSKCSSLKELNISNFNTNNVTNMSYMFWRCSSLEKLNISNFNINKVTNMMNMFNGCYSLKELNYFNFNNK